MRRRTGFLIFAAPLLYAHSVTAQPHGKTCESLAQELKLPNGKITSAEVVPAGGFVQPNLKPDEKPSPTFKTTPAFCRVMATLTAVPCRPSTASERSRCCTSRSWRGRKKNRSRKPWAARSRRPSAGRASRLRSRRRAARTPSDCRAARVSRTAECRFRKGAARRFAASALAAFIEV